MGKMRLGLVAAVVGISMLVMAGCSSAAPMLEAAPAESVGMPSLEDCESSPEEYAELCEMVLAEVEETKPTAPAENSGSSCPGQLLSDRMGMAMSPVVFRYDQRGFEHHYGAEVSEDFVVMRFTNLYEQASPGVELWAYPEATMIRDVTTFDAFASWQGGIGSPATEIESGEWTWAAHQENSPETVTYFQAADDGSMLYMLKFMSGGAWSDRAEPLDTDATFAAASEMHPLLCAS